MVINEKSLVTRMKEAYKTYGYTVAVDEEMMYISNGFWLVGIAPDQVPGEILGMFGEHIRDIPKCGDAYKVTKAKDGPIVQHRILEDALKVVGTMHAKRDEAWDDIPLVMMRRTNLTYEGMQVWQALPGLDVYLIDPRYASMIRNIKDVSRVGNGIYIQDELSELWVLRVMKPEDDKFLKHLEKIAWVPE